MQRWRLAHSLPEISRNAPVQLESAPRINGNFPRINANFLDISENFIDASGDQNRRQHALFRVRRARKIVSCGSIDINKTSIDIRETENHPWRGPAFADAQLAGHHSGGGVLPLGGTSR